MTDWRERMESGSEILRHQAVRIPLPDVDAERSVHDNMMRIAAAGERKSKLLDDPDVPLTEVYEDELAEMRQSFKHRLQQVAGEDYYDVATAYLDGERDDWIGALAAYYLDCYYRLQERYTVDEHIFFLVILRYPECITVNLSFPTGEISSDAVRYESAKHVESELDEHDQKQFYADCQYSQHKAAEYLRENVDCIREAFPDPETTLFKQRRYGGFVHITGRQGATFAEILESLSPNPDRFDDEASTPGLVSEGSEAKRAKQEFLTDAKIVL
ncbi:hypothetical protein [Salarchaeum sp. JOR-1]|uniref:hypothetical protein n=1 Tax=Salarchaeum sp. JOR-1 TaxID=2599399 RepID=UPI0011986AAB|nr:hypothetical protein [Salarchaeum sp. JOR-1]QDX39441.1 hypothetical protein FQU85_00565 [Salarchaeum sp. JOR-1]